MFFEKVNWDTLRICPAPFVPKTTDILDTSNFDKEKNYKDNEKIDPFFGLPKGK